MSYLNNIAGITKRVEEAQNLVCSFYNLNVKDISNKSRKPRHTQARFAVWYILYRINKFSLSTIGDLFGYDHTTILHGIRRAEALNIPKELNIGTVDKVVDSGRKTIEQPVHNKSTGGIPHVVPSRPVDKKG